jgi:hypothetical protein
MITAIAPLETSSSRAAAAASATQRESWWSAREIGSRYWSIRIASSPLALRDGGSRRTLRRRTESLHVPPGSESVVHGHAVKPIVRGETGEPVPLRRFSRTRLAAAAEGAPGRQSFAQRGIGEYAGYGASRAAGHGLRGDLHGGRRGRAEAVDDREQRQVMEAELAGEADVQAARDARADQQAVQI